MTGDDAIARIMADAIYEPPPLVRTRPVSSWRGKAALLFLAAIALTVLGLAAASAWAAAYPLGPCDLPECGYEQGQ